MNFYKRIYKKIKNRKYLIIKKIKCNKIKKKKERKKETAQTETI